MVMVKINFSHSKYKKGFEDKTKTKTNYPTGSYKDDFIIQNAG